MTPLFVMMMMVATQEEIAPPPTEEVAPPAPEEVAPPPTEEVAPPPTAETPPRPDECLELLRAGEREKAHACYIQRAASDDTNARLARELADLVGALELTPPKAELVVEKPAEIDFATLLTTGKAELAATATLTGGYAATIGTFSLLSLASNSSSSAGFGLLLLAPVVGGAAGLGATIYGISTWPEMTAGDANAMRALLLLGAADSIMFPFIVQSSGTSFNAMVPLGMFALQIGGAAAAIGVALTTDLPESAGSFAISTGAWTPVLLGLGGLMFDAFKQSPQIIPSFIAATMNAGFIAGLSTAQFVPLSRAETWALDVGGGVGLLTGIAVALSFAPNPFLGYGTILTGTALGMAGGVAAAKLVPLWLEGLPQVVAIAPMTVPSVDGKSVVYGAGLVGRIE